MPAVRAEHGVIGPQMSTDARGHCFLADIGVAGAGDLACRIQSDQLFLAAADDQHLPVQGQHLRFTWARH